MILLGVIMALWVYKKVRIRDTVYTDIVRGKGSQYLGIVLKHYKTMANVNNYYI